MVNDTHERQAEAAARKMPPRRHSPTVLATTVRSSYAAFASKRNATNQ